ncbi:Cyclin [Parasponia andersonii]|uniref:B-like cyclin n=1 Tax=Parasponia andersonii TaxID=3476 RepID=A0A2P5AP67_PARAD|nr:Cyclin [Parasponia andersonii]
MWLELPNYDPYNPLFLSEDQGLEGYLGVESVFIPEGCPVTLESIRRRALLVIFKYSKCENCGPIIPYLAMNYYDRIITKETQVPGLSFDDYEESLTVHSLDLLALCCLTLAWKMRNRNFTIPKLQARQPDLLAIIRRRFHTMEHYILKQLEWEMHIVTPFCFLRYFEPKLDPICSFFRKTTNQIIIHAQSEFFFTSFKPSVVAALALLAASLCLCPTQYSSFYRKLLSEKIITEKQAVTCIPSMVIICKELKLSPERGVLENEQLLISEQAAEAEKLAVLNNLNKLQIKYLSEPASDSEQVATEAEQSETSTSSQRTAVKGKEKVLETTEIRNTTEDRKAMQLDFPLRWTDGLAYGEEFVIFGPLQPDDDEFLLPDQLQGGPMVALRVHNLIGLVREINHYTLDKQQRLIELAPSVLHFLNQLALDDPEQAQVAPDQEEGVPELAQVVPDQGQGDPELHQVVSNQGQDDPELPQVVPVQRQGDTELPQVVPDQG